MNESRPGKKESLAAGVAVRPFGDGDQRHLDAEFREHLARDAELALAAVDQDEIGPRRLGPIVRDRYVLILRRRFGLPRNGAF